MHAAPAVGSADGDGGGGSGSVELVGVGELPADPGDADVEMTNEARLRQGAAPALHLLARLPKNPSCPTRRFAKAPRRQLRQQKHQGNRVLRPRSEPMAFVDLTAMDHWFAADELSKGLRGETACVTFRDRYANSPCASGVCDKSSAHVCIFLLHLKVPREKLSYCYADFAKELARACKVLKIARDPAIPGNRRHKSIAERSAGIARTGGRALLVQAGLPPDLRNPLFLPLL